MHEYDPIETNAMHTAMELVKQDASQQKFNTTQQYVESFKMIYAGVIAAVCEGRKSA